ncbi:DUF2141 domain-containing protein [Sphingosinicella rhizophila]|uniref:DUF2141 domain-containing protein n=1 Tax=Sphingosinicella rhizophila TaxID=3050082 RepID=A0ABU3Q6E7_9SPHN|nr:DUF2141 domain-containing protein [Sphingosinicella sp. GR2756]MDT9598976.1 DUF2141 domain-containing protein [Sphingosinicella sp. GR2756]
MSFQPLQAEPAPTARSGSVEIRIERLRSARGLVQICLTADPDRFPDCRDDPAASRMTLPAASATLARFSAVVPGDYAIALLHDENGNGRMDMFVMVPKEGFGFSNNAPIRFGPPSFADARFTVGPGTSRQTIRMRYIL